jgi:hypothetical protein
MLPSGITTLLWEVLADHPALAFTCVHVEPLFIDRQTSFTGLKPLSQPPISTMLPSGITTLQ